MIHYETEYSPFFLENKKYCELLESTLKTMNADCSGFCNSFGYEVTATLKKSNLVYSFKFHKHQSTRDGGIVPFNADNYAGSEMKVTGLNQNNDVHIGKSALKRIFSSGKLKAQLPGPYYIRVSRSQDNGFINDLAQYILQNNISKLMVSKGELVCVIHAKTEDPLKLIGDLEKIATSLL